MFSVVFAFVIVIYMVYSSWCFVSSLGFFKEVVTFNLIWWVCWYFCCFLVLFTPIWVSMSGL